MTIDLSLITKLNNQGADSISSNNLVSSIKDLTSALKIAQRALSSSASQNATEHGAVANSSFPTSLLFIDNWMTSSGERDAHQPAISTTNKHDPRTGDDSCSSSLFSYKHPIYIPDDVTAALNGQSSGIDNELSFHLLQMIAIAITFNLGVAFQQMSASSSAGTPRNTESTLIRSLKLFQQSLCLCQTTYSDWGATQNNESSNALLLLATLNNVAVLHKSLGEAERANTGFHNLLSALMMCIVFEDDQNKASRYTVFFHNTAQLSYPNCSICAGSA